MKEDFPSDVILTKRLPAADLELICSHTRPLWEEIRGQNLFMTGGTGFFGRWLLESFLHANYILGLEATATVLTRNPEAFQRRSPYIASHKAIRVVKGDVCSFPFPSAEYPYVIHAATEVHVAGERSQRPNRFTDIVDGTRRILDFASARGGRKLLLTSSGAVYGRQPSSLSRIPEDYSGAPSTLDSSSAYGEGKRASELMCTLSQNDSKLECKLARCFAFVGPGLTLDGNFAIGNFIRDAIADRPISILGDGTPLRSYLYAADLAIWLWTILFRAPAGQAFNVGSEKAISISDLARTVAATLNPQLEIRVAREPDLHAAPVRYVPSTQLAQQVLGLQQTIDLRESIRRTAAWHGFQSP